ncbi:MAG: hypothetical protein ACR2IK_21585 [Chloroflexota bacterium]
MTVASSDSSQRQALAAVERGDWAQTRTELHRAMARDAIWFGQRNPGEAKKLADHFVDEIEDSPLAIQMAVVGVRQALEESGATCAPAVSTFLRMWMREMDRRLADQGRLE